MAKARKSKSARSEAARRGWATRRARERAAAREAKRRAEAARKGWERRRQREREVERKARVEVAKREKTRPPRGSAPEPSPVLADLEDWAERRDEDLADVIDDWAGEHDLDLHDAYDLLYGYA